MRTRSVLAVLFDGVQSLDVTGPLEVFSGANAVRAQENHAPAYTVTTASLGGNTVRTSSGLRITPDGDLADAAEPDVLLVPGGPGTRSPDDALVAWLGEHGRRARQVVSVCTGAFLLAEAGILSGRRATTHWAFCDALATRYPDIDVAAEPIFVRDGHVATSAGVTTGIDLALTLVEDDVGREVALTVARYLVVFLRRTGNQAQWSTQLAAQTAQRDPLRDVQQWIVNHPDADLSVDALAARANLSPRQFSRAFTAEVGMPPGRYVDRVRLEAARRRLADTGDGIEETARACGYGTAEAMRRAFVRELGEGPSAYRRRHHPLSTPAAKECHADRHSVV